MAIVAVMGDAATTTSVSIAIAWPATDDVLLVEADPKGGDLAAWFDMPVVPSLSTVVTRVLDGSWPEVERLTRVSPVGLRVLPAPAGAAEAQQAVAESARVLALTLSSLRTPVVIADVGDVPTRADAHPFLSVAAVAVVVHRQSPQSARAAAVRLQRLSDQITALNSSVPSIVVVVVGAVPYGPDEVATFLSAGSGDVAVVALPIDPLAASVVAGRTGVSARRLARLPLMRSAQHLAGVIDVALESQLDGLWRGAR
jgi:MinD-like ATPase involved in chromosome partitioning or flagellar assembly